MLSTTEREVAVARLAAAYRTRWGRAYQADALTVLRRLDTESISLVFTSPPFALRRQKAYGNVAANEYVDWFWPFAQEIHRVLRADGSFVFDLGGAWNRSEERRVGTSVTGVQTCALPISGRRLDRASSAGHRVDLACFHLSTFCSEAAKSIWQRRG